MPQPPHQQIAGIYHRQVGDILVTAISDGYLDAPYTIMRIKEDEAAHILTGAFRPAPPRISINAFLVYSGGRVALIETGSGNTMGPTLGKVLPNLAAAGVTPRDVETVLLTHVHPDHSNGLIDDDGKAVFTASEIIVHQNEITHWHDDAQMAKAPERQQIRYFQGGRRALAPYRSQLRPFTDGGPVFPGITAILIPGHTPGHTGYLIESRGERLLIWGDIVHVPEVQLARPSMSMEFDTDPAAAVETRLKVLKMTASERLLVAGMHLHFPAFGHIRKAGEGYEFVPEAWRHAL